MQYSKRAATDHARKSSRTNSPGFTLLELLVVIGIIALLVALLFPVIDSVRRQAYGVQCLANQRQLTAAISLYAADNYDVVIYTGWGSGSATNPIPNWLFNPANPTVGSPVTAFKTQYVQTGLLWPWLRSASLYHCPLDDKTWSTSSVQYITSYVMNGAFNSYTYGTRLHLRQFHPDDIAFWELPAYSTTGKISVNDPSNYPPEGVTLRHLNCTTVGYVDGHAAMMADTEFNAECQSGPSHLWCDPMSPKDGGTSKWGAIPNPIPTFY